MADLLIVDDNEEIASLLEIIMADAGHSVRTAYNGAEGLHALEERLPDLVVMDVEMPVLDGPGMIYRMLVEDCGKECLPVVLVSGASDLGQIGRRVGTPYVLAKPFDPLALIDLTARALRERLPPTPHP